MTDERTVGAIKEGQRLWSWKYPWLRRCSNDECETPHLEHYSRGLCQQCWRKWYHQELRSKGGKEWRERESERGKVYYRQRRAIEEGKTPPPGIKPWGLREVMRRRGERKAKKAK